MKKILSLLLSMVLIVSSFSTAVFATDSESISVYVSACKYGEFIADKLGNSIVNREIVLSEKEEYTLNDVFDALHQNYYDGEEGYKTEMGDFGEYITRFFGDESENFVYYVNFGAEDVWGPTHIVKDGDSIDFCINKSFYPDTESYTKFSSKEAVAFIGDEVEFILEESSYTADGLTFFPCADALLTVNGEETEALTNEEGKATLSFEDAGVYVVSAKKTKLVEEESVTAITAPYCVVTVSERPEKEITENIISKYFDISLTNDGNFCWFVADFAEYISLFPETLSFSSEMKQAFVDKLVELGESAETQGDIAKTIIALRALGYDAKNVYNENSVSIDFVKKLTDMITPESVQEAYYEFTLPYVLIALQQGENYVAPETVDFLIDTAINSKAAWQDTSWGTDGASPMLRALAPYYNENEAVKNAIDETIALLFEYQGESGSMGGAASTGLAIFGLSSVKVNSYDVKSGEGNLIDGLLTDVNENKDGFLPDTNSFSTEQGFRGLVSLKLFLADKVPYDFSQNPMNEARATVKAPTGGGGGSSGGGGGGVVKPVNKPEKEEVKEEIKEETKKEEEKIKIIYVPEEKYQERTFEDIKDHKNKEAIEELAKRGIVNGMDGKNFCPSNTMTRAEFATIVVQALGLKEQNGKTFEDVKENDWFYKYIETAEFYGIIKGVSETSFNPDGQITRQEAATMVVRAAALCDMETTISEDFARDILAQFPDYTQSSDWAKSALAFCYNSKILDTSVEKINPVENITRAEVAQMLYNMLTYGKLV